MRLDVHVLKSAQQPSRGVVFGKQLEVAHKRLASFRATAQRAVGPGE